ncbi:MAG: hypothetical protein NC120_09270 [Ruminococcus sp.]|nr:hypothetical protein [Ruminococcus sp.]
MSVSEAHKRASAKYDKNNMDTIGIKDRKDVVQRIKQYAKDNNISLNKLCIGSVLYCIDNNIDVSNVINDKNNRSGNNADVN